MKARFNQYKNDSIKKLRFASKKRKNLLLQMAIFAAEALGFAIAVNVLVLAMFFVPTLISQQ